MNSVISCGITRGRLIIPWARAGRIMLCMTLPGSAWPRGSNENTNGLLRQYFPKGTDLSSFSQDDLDQVALKLYTRPRKTLGYATPSERFDAALALTG
jgi:IS30 family transposase